MKLLLSTARTSLPLFALAFAPLVTLLVAARPGCAEIIDSKHNLSVSGLGSVKSSIEDEICIFCHSPHNASPSTPLWNRTIPNSIYVPYTSPTSQAVTGQPTHVSKLCLSCHDGTIALGAVLSSETPIALTALSGRSALTTDLSDDHPVSFDYDSALASRDPELLDPTLLTGPVELDAHGQVQCTTCHATHSSPFPKLLVMDPAFSALCLTCHDKSGWSGSAHATSTASWDGAGANPWPHTDRKTVAANGCENCHVSHGAPSFEWLLVAFPEEEACLRCHDGSVARPSVESEILKPYAHAVDSFTMVHDPTEDPATMPRHVECQDCHNPHATSDATAWAPHVGGPLRNVEGITASGLRIPAANFEYEVCFRCHADGADVPTPTIERQIAEPNLRLAFSTTNPSFHPVESVGRSSSVPGLVSPLSETSIIYCTDCHASDSGPGAGGPGAGGPHGSIWPFLLEREYRTADFSPESLQAYALCYKCHDRSTLFTDSQTGFKDHRKHVQGEDTPCSVCHDPHGITSTRGTTANNSHLINFDVTIVQPDPDTGRLQFGDLGSGQGECYLSCHGKKHSPKRYP